MDDGFFRNEVSWDGIVGAIALTLWIIAILGAWARSRWRKAHPLRVAFSRDPYALSSDMGEQRFKNSWQLPRMGMAEMLINIAPHDGTVLKKIRVRLVERRWFSRGRLWHWVTAERQTIHLDNMYDMFYENSSSPLYYFDSMIEPTTGSFEGVYFQDHDPERGVAVPAGGGLWIGLMVSAWCPWAGRLEIATVVAGQRVFERKPLRVTDENNVDAVTFSLGQLTKNPRVSAADAGTTSSPPASPESTPGTASPLPKQ